MERKWFESFKFSRARQIVRAEAGETPRTMLDGPERSTSILPFLRNRWANQIVARCDTCARHSFVCARYLEAIRNRGEDPHPLQKPQGMRHPKLTSLLQACVPGKTQGLRSFAALRMTGLLFGAHGRKLAVGTRAREAVISTQISEIRKNCREEEPTLCEMHATGRPPAFR